MTDVFKGKFVCFEDKKRFYKIFDKLKSWIMFHKKYYRVSLRILLAGERCNVKGEYCDRGPISEFKKIVRGYWKFAREFCIVNREFSDLWYPIDTLSGNDEQKCWVVVGVSFQMLRAWPFNSRVRSTLVLARFAHAMKEKSKYSIKFVVCVA